MKTVHLNIVIDQRTTHLGRSTISRQYGYFKRQWGDELERPVPTPNGLGYLYDPDAILEVIFDVPEIMWGNKDEVEYDLKIIALKEYREQLTKMAWGKKTKGKIYIKIGNDIFETDHKEYSALKPVDYSRLQEEQAAALSSENGWAEVGDYNDPMEAYHAFKVLLNKIREQNKLRTQEIKTKESESISELIKEDVIPATVSNIALLLRHLHSQNWGSWTLPKLSIGYSAHQYDCEGIKATTITLDQPISDEVAGILNETKFKVGGKNGHLTNYTLLR